MHYRLSRLLLGVAAAAIAGTGDAATDATPDALGSFGRALFFDRNLSRDRTQSCATCHDPARAFSDGRANGVAGAVSLGADGRTLGERNTPSLAYAALVPPLERSDNGDYRGGLFHDGRAQDLTEQAAGPLLNPREMQMADGAAVVARIRENAAYLSTMTLLFGAAIVADNDRAFAALRSALAAFEQTPLFVAFDARYDRALRGEEQLSTLEEQGRTLFFSTLTNCSSCHVLATTTLNAREPFTSYRYFNIGIPANAALRARSGHAAPDRGLRANPLVTDDRQAGKFRVPSLRNVAVTAPYMHNGVFRELATAISFYNQYLVDNATTAINPETGATWGLPETPATIDRELLRGGQPLDQQRIGALIAFLRTLTDRRFESWLKN